MATREELAPVTIQGIEALPSGRFLYLVHHAETGQDLGSIRICDDRRLEAITPTGHFAGVHKTVAEAVDSLSLAAEIHQRPPREYATRSPGPPPAGNGRSAEVYAGQLARRNISG